MTTYFFMMFVLLITAELVKGLSANGTPPVLQRFSGQMGLAYVMWSSMMPLRIILFCGLVFVFILMPAEARAGVFLAGLPLAALWAGIYWLFNRYWVGRFKFLPITEKRFTDLAQNSISPDTQVLGISHNGEQKAYPVNMLFYHHQITDEVGGQPVWVTYCGLCRSGRIYNRLVNGQLLDFSLVGAITFNAVFRDHATGSWWRQETGECAKGPMTGTALEDMPFEQMSLSNWLGKYPDSLILQYDPVFEKKYMFTAGLLNYELSLPGWHMHKTPPLILGVEIGDVARAYDWEQLTQHRLVQDEVNHTPLVVMCDDKASTGFVYDRTVDGTILDFHQNEKGITDRQTGSVWDLFGRCVSGKMKGQHLQLQQSYKQYIRAWLSFHPNASFYHFDTKK